jgi:hypothetical protein
MTLRDVRWVEVRFAKYTLGVLQDHIRTRKPRVLFPQPRQCRAARSEDWTYERFAEAVLASEVASRESHGGESRIGAARLPARKTLEQFDFSFAQSVKKTIVLHLGQLDFLGTYHRGHRGLPLARVGAFLGALWIWLLLLLLPLPIGLFPDGRLSQRWRRVVWAYLAVAAFFVAASTWGGCDRSYCSARSGRLTGRAGVD